MKKTQVDFLLTVSQLFQKLENGEDCKKECEQVARMNDEQKESVSGQLLDRLQARDSKEVEKLVTAAKQVEYLKSKGYEVTENPTTSTTLLLLSASRLHRPPFRSGRKLSRECFPAPATARC